MKTKKGRVHFMKSMIHVGFIGCGRISDLHAQGYESLPHARIHAVCDSDKATAENRKEQWGAKHAYTNYTEMLENPELDAVEILTPQLFHEEMAIRAAAAGKHIALQKPMTISLACADRILEAVEASDITFKVTDNYVCYPPIVLAKKMIDSGDIGDPTNIRIKMISGGSGGWDVPASAWQWRVKESAEGRGIQTFDHGHHLWAAAWYLLGEIDRVSSWIDSIDGIVDSPAVMIWKYKGRQAYGMCEYSYALGLEIPSLYYANDEWFEITGTNGIIVIHRCTGNIVDGPAVSLFNSKGWKHYTEVKSDWSVGFTESTRNFLHSIRGEAEPLLSGRQGREILKLNLAIQKSSRLRREVFLDEMDARFPGLHAWKQRHKEIRAQQPSKSLLERLGLTADDSRYAAEAENSTDQLIGRFNADAAGEWTAEIGLELLPEGSYAGIRYHLTIQDGKATLAKNRLPENPAVLLKVPAGTWAAILLGKRRIETAFLQGKLKIEGKAEHGLKLREVFGI
jgi:predicted dehydrogenase/putative sterol carrier protein